MIDQQGSPEASVNISPFIYEEVRMKIMTMLSVPVEFDDDDNLIELGLDSLKIMRMVNKWRRAGSMVTFAELIEAPRLRDWWSLLQKNNTEFSGVNEVVREIEAHQDVNEPFSLTDVQHAYWIGRRDDQPLGGVGCHAYLEIDGKGVEPQRLELAWTKLLTHHSMLRARFLANGQQEVLDTPFTKALLVHDLRLYSERELTLKLKRIRNRLSHRRLRVEKGEVIGLELSLLPDGYTRLHFDIDLLVADVQSLQIIIRDLAAAYGRGCQPAAPINWSFSKYSKQEAQRRSLDKKRAGQYWKRRLLTLPGAPGLPLKERPEAIRSPVFKRRNYIVKSADWTILQKRSAAHRVTPAMALLAAYAEVLGRWSTKSQFLINIPLFDRPTGEAGIEDVVADFTNLLLLAVDCSLPQSFLERARGVQTQFHKDVANAAYSGIQIQRDMARVRQGERMFAPVVFACNLGTPLINAECRETLGKLSYMISQTPQVWLDFQVYETDDGLLLAWDAVDALFPDGLIDQMFTAFTQFIEWLAADNNDWQSSLNVLPSAQQQIRDRDVELSIPQSTQCLHTSFFDFAAANPQQTALIDSHSNMHLTYGELCKYALQVAALLKKHGVMQGDPVAVTLPRGTEQIAAVFGILALGACYAPISVEQPSVRRDRIHKKAAIRYVLTNHEQAQTIDWPADAVVLDIANSANTIALAEPVEVSPERLAYIIFTSGSTGEPKGVEISHCAAWNTIAEINRRYNVSATDRILAVSSLDFDLSVYDIFGLLSVGGVLVLITEDTRRDAAHWLKLLNRYQVTIWNSVPVLLDMLLVVAESEQQKTLLLRLTMLSGDWIGLDIPTRLHSIAGHCHLIAMGGATEASIWSNFFDVTLPLPAHWTSIPYGRPLANQAYRVVDSKGRDCPDWVAGELWIGGAGVAQGYRGEPKLTAERFVKWNGSPWYRTGDLGRYLPDGNIEFLGREDFQVKIRGHRIELGEIETALKRHPGVRDAVVTAAGDHRGSKHLVGYVVLDQKQEASLLISKAHFVKPPKPGIGIIDELGSFLKQKLPDYMVPSSLIVLDKLPLSPNGKVDRQALPAPEDVRPEREKIIVAPRTPTEVSLAHIWAQVLNINHVSIHDNFFELGGDSLLAIQLVSRLRQTLRVELPLENLFETPNIAELAGFIRIAMEKEVKGEDFLVPFPEIVPDPEHRHLPFPLTDIQQAYWIGRSGDFELGNIATHFYIEIESDHLNIEALNLAWQRVIDRHEMLRAVVLPDGQQKILDQVPPYQFDVMDLREQNEEVVEAELSAIRQVMSHQILPADRWPLFDIRASLFGDSRVRLHISFDALIVDVWSVLSFISDWYQFYQGTGDSLIPLDLSFRDYVLAETALQNSELYLRDKEYWFNRLSSLPPSPELPLARDPGSIKQPRFNRRSFTLVAEVWQNLKSQATQNGLTSSGLLIAAYADVLRAWSKSPRFTINLTLFNRLPLHPQVNNIVGDFTSLTLLAVDNSGGERFITRASQLQQQLWRDLDHRHFSGIRVLREMARLRGEFRRLAMPVVFTSALNMESLGRDGSGLNKLGELVYSISQTSQVWLDHQVYEQDGDLILTWDAVEELFPEGLLDDMFEAYCRFLQRLADEEKSWQETTQQLIPASQLEKRAEVNATKASISCEMLHTLFRNQVLQQPDQLAVVSCNRALTYGELSRRSNQIGHLLREKGAQPNALVAVVMEKGWEQVVGVLGILNSGAAYLPIDPTVPKKRFWHLLEDGEVGLVLTQSRLDEKLEWPEGIQRFPLDKMELTDRNITPLEPVQRPDDLAYVIYTSGSTGLPKGVMIDHRGAVNTILDVNKRFGVGPEDKVLALSNLNFDLSVYDTFGTLAAGGTIVLPDAGGTKDPAHWIELMRQEEVTVWNSVPALMQMLVEYIPNESEKMLQSLRLVLLSGDWIPLDLPDQIKALFKDVRVISLGGATEASIWSNLYPIKEVDPDWKSIPYGRPMVNQRFYVLNEFMQDSPDWVPGQLYIGGIGLAQGYWGNEEKTEASFIIHPRTGDRLYRTGDLGRYLPDGNIEFLGREDFQVKIRGYRIELGEIEAALETSPEVQDAVVITEGEPPSLAAAVVLHADSSKTENEIGDELRAFLATQLPGYMVPNKIIVLKALPLNANGKVDRTAIGQTLKQHQITSISEISEPPRDALEQQIATIWTDILQMQELSRNDDFFLHGGDSLKATRIIGQLRTQQVAPRGISLRTLFAAPTVATLAEQIRIQWSKQPPEQEPQHQNFEEGIL